MEGKLIKVDRNGSKHFEGLIECDRCGGHGYFAIGVHNGKPVLSPYYGGICYKCGGRGKVVGKWIERTPEYQAKLDTRREAKRKEAEEKRKEVIEKERAEWLESERKKQEERLARERAEAERKAISQYIGEIGERVKNVKVIYQKSFSFKVKAFNGFGMETRYIHLFKDEAGNVIVWKTSNSIGYFDEKGYWAVYDEGSTLVLTGTVKNHTVYNGEKQTELQRCKIA